MGGLCGAVSSVPQTTASSEKVDGVAGRVMLQDFLQSVRTLPRTYGVVYIVKVAKLQLWRRGTVTKLSRTTKIALQHQWPVCAGDGEKQQR